MILLLDGHLEHHAGQNKKPLVGHLSINLVRKICYNKFACRLFALKKHLPKQITNKVIMSCLNTMHSFVEYLNLASFYQEPVTKDDGVPCQW